MDSTHDRDLDAHPNPFLVRDIVGLTDEDLRDRTAIYEGLRDRLDTGPRSVHDVLGQVQVALDSLVAEATRRRLAGA